MSSQPHEVAPGAPASTSAEASGTFAAHELRLVFEPIVSLTTDRLVGVEALVRWDDPRRRLRERDAPMGASMPPSQIAAMGNWALREGCRQAAAWSGASIVMSFDVSAAQFEDGFAETVRDALTDSGVAPSLVCMELTEETLNRDVGTTSRILTALRRLGVSVAIDHFGSGFASLESRRTMEVGSIKTPSLVQDLDATSEDMAMVASLIGLAHAMGLSVIAEEVENVQQLERLRSLGCDAAQGPHVGAPLTGADMARHVEAAAAGRSLSVGPGGAAPTPAAATILLVDDSDGDRLLTKTSLLAAGFAVEEADNGRDALARAQTLRPDCVLLDMQLPDMSGIDVCTALRAHPDTSECTIVMLSIHDGNADKAESFLVGADDYVIKPSSPRDLVARVGAALRRRAAAPSTSVARADPALLEMLHEARGSSLHDVVAELEPLSARQLEILRRLLDGDRVPSIARDLYVSASTVRNHLSSIFRKLGVHSQEELLALLRSIQVAHKDTRTAEAESGGPRRPALRGLRSGLTAGHG